MKKVWWGLFFGALIGVVFFAPESNFARRIWDLFQLPAVAVAVYGLFDLFMKPYMNEKAKNLATKEDVGAITQQVEEVKLAFDKEREEHKTQNALRMAAFEQRFRAHQEAHALWFKLIQSVHNDNCNEVVIECQTWWMNNSLYLDGEARDAFNRAYMAANHHSAFVDARGDAELVKKNWSDIERAGTAIAQSVGLPNIAADKPEPPKEASSQEVAA